jgi:hypothetical protein
MLCRCVSAVRYAKFGTTIDTLIPEMHTKGASSVSNNPDLQERHPCRFFREICMAPAAFFTMDEPQGKPHPVDSLIRIFPWLAPVSVLCLRHLMHSSRVMSTSTAIAGIPRLSHPRYLQLATKTSPVAAAAAASIYN